MRRRIKFIFCVVLCVIICSFIVVIIYHLNSNDHNPKGPIYNDYPYVEEIAIDVVDYLNNGNIENFKGLLSETVLARQDLKEQLDVLFDFCSDYEISDKKISCGPTASSRKDGQYTYKSIRVVVDEAIVFDNESYSIDLYYVLVDDDNERNIGLSKILIRDTDKSIMMRFI